MRVLEWKPDEMAGLVLNAVEVHYAGHFVLDAMYPEKGDIADLVEMCATVQVENNAAGSVGGWVSVKAENNAVLPESNLMSPEKCGFAGSVGSCVIVRVENNAVLPE